MQISELKNIFSDDSTYVSIVVFCEDEKINQCTKQLEDIDGYKHISVVIQPCAYEGIEFLFRAPIDLPNSSVCEETEFFVHSFFTPRCEMFETLPDVHHAFLVAILEQDIKKIHQSREAMLECLD